MSHAELLEALQLFFALGDRLESVFYLDKQDFARFRQGNTAGGAVKKRRAKTLFELGDRDALVRSIGRFCRDSDCQCDGRVGAIDPAA